jgi:pimeloyl-ACP methyl ester carboxylesterase|tara:strand:+ start:1483 stop:2331 length:849 start_codon:yes stop_codon:yes gene_type:complete
VNRVFKVSEDREIIASEWGDNMNPLVIMLHGGGQTRHSWKGVAAKIANLGFYVIAHDLRGHGESFWDSNGDYTFDAHRDDLVKIIQQLGKKANLVGASLGGMISLSLAGHEEESKHCSGLIMVDIGMRPNDEGSDRIVEFMRSGAKGFASVEEAADAVSGYLPHRERPKDISGLKKNLRLKEDGRYYWHWDPLFLTDRTGMGEVREERFKQLENSAKRITVPTLLVQGALSDILTNKEKEEFLNAVPHAKLAEIQQATHMVVGDKNDIFAEAIVDFLSEQTK